MSSDANITKIKIIVWQTILIRITGETCDCRQTENRSDDYKHSNFRWQVWMYSSFKKKKKTNILRTLSEVGQFKLYHCESLLYWKQISCCGLSSHSILLISDLRIKKQKLCPNKRLKIKRNKSTLSLALKKEQDNPVGPSRTHGTWLSVFPIIPPNKWRKESMVYLYRIVVLSSQCHLRGKLLHSLRA